MQTSHESRFKLRPLVSVIIAVYNGEKYLKQTIDSVLGQTYSNIECIVIDGASVDKSTDIMRDYKQENFIWISEKDRGIYDAWNKGVKKAKGEWISFIGCDDILYADAVFNYVRFINENQSHNFEYLSSRIELVTNNLKLKRVVGAAWQWKKFRNHMNVGHVGSFHHITLFEKYGAFDISYKIAGDYELLLRAHDHLKAGFMDKITVKMRTENTLSMSNASHTQKETFRAKINTAKRSKISAYLEMGIAVLKAKIRATLGI